VAGTCECGNEPSDSIQCGEFLGQLRNCYLLEKGLALHVCLFVSLVCWLSGHLVGFSARMVVPPCLGCF
jgi:hypothetical protein